MHFLSEEEFSFIEKQLGSIQKIAENSSAIDSLKVCLIEDIATSTIEELNQIRKESGLDEVRIFDDKEKGQAISP